MAETKTSSLTPIEKLKKVMTRLRHPDEGCPWDREQTFASVAPYTIEEAYEVSDAVDCNDMPALKEELGDLLLQIIFHSRIAEEAGYFNFDEVTQSITDKMVRRHPHVFGEDSERSKEFHSEEWEAQKRRERAEKASARGDTPGVLNDVALALPALMRAEKLGKRVAKAGFDWPEKENIINKINEDIADLKAKIKQKDNFQESAENELGEILLNVVSLARHLKVDPELALRRANTKFVNRFRTVEEQLATAGDVPEKINIEAYKLLWEAE